MGRPSQCNPCCGNSEPPLPPTSTDCIFSPITNEYNIFWSLQFSGTNNGNPWVLSNNDKTIRYNVEDSTNCGGSNNKTQTGIAICCITTGPCSVLLNVDYDGVGEKQDDNFEVLRITLNGAIIGQGNSPGGSQGCAMGPVIKNPPTISPIFLSPNNVHELKIDFSTGDGLYHLDAYYQIDLTLSQICV